METLPVILMGPLSSIKTELLPFPGEAVLRSTVGILSLTSSIKISVVYLVSKSPSEIETVTNRLEGSSSRSVLTKVRARSNDVTSSGDLAPEYCSVRPSFKVSEGGTASDMDPI